MGFAGRASSRRIWRKARNVKRELELQLQELELRGCVHAAIAARRRWEAEALPGQKLKHKPHIYERVRALGKKSGVVRAHRARVRNRDIARRIGEWTRRGMPKMEAYRLASAGYRCSMRTAQSAYAEHLKEREYARNLAFATNLPKTQAPDGAFGVLERGREAGASPRASEFEVQTRADKLKPPGIVARGTDSGSCCAQNRPKSAELRRRLAAGEFLGVHVRVKSSSALIERLRAPDSIESLLDGAYRRRCGPGDAGA